MLVIDEFKKRQIIIKLELMIINLGEELKLRPFVKNHRFSDLKIIDRVKMLISNSLRLSYFKH